MANNNLVIELEPRTDSEGRTFYVGKLQCPILIDCSQGAAFLLFISEPGAEVLQIAPFSNKSKNQD